MMKNSKREVIVTTVLCLLPMAAGALLYDRLPETVATHFGMNGEPNGWSSRAFAVFGIPLMIAAFNLLLHFALRTDPKKQNMNPTLRALAVWIMPVMSIVLYALTIGAALGRDVRIDMVVPVLIGLLFVLIGNYLPKTKQSYTMGIRLPWTLASEENWNRTHRIAGFVWVLGGAAMIAISLLGLWSAWLLLAIALVQSLVPCVYSYLLYKKGI